MYHYYWGMHAYWWIFWVILWMLFLGFMTPVRRSNWATYQECKRLCNSCKGGMPPGRSQPRNTRNAGLNFCGMPRCHKSRQCPCLAARRHWRVYWREQTSRGARRIHP